MRRTPSQEAALALAAKTAIVMKIEATGQWGRYADMRRSSSQEAALALEAKTAKAIRIEATGPWGPCADVRRSSSQRATLALPAKTTEAMIIETAGQWGPCANVDGTQIKGRRESVRYSRGTPRARAPERGDNAENGLGNENRDDGPVGVL